MNCYLAHLLYTDWREQSLWWSSFQSTLPLTQGNTNTPPPLQQSTDKRCQMDFEMVKLLENLWPFSLSPNYGVAVDQDSSDKGTIA